MHPYLVDAETFGKYAQTMAEVANDTLTNAGEMPQEAVEMLTDALRNWCVEQGMDVESEEFAELVRIHEADPMKFFHIKMLETILSSVFSAAEGGLFAAVPGTIAEIRRIELPDSIKKTALADGDEIMGGGGIEAFRRPMDDVEIDNVVNNAMVDVDDFLKNLTAVSEDDTDEKWPDC